MHLLKTYTFTSFKNLRFFYVAFDQILHWEIAIKKIFFCEKLFEFHEKYWNELNIVKSRSYNIENNDDEIESSNKWTKFF